MDQVNRNDIFVVSSEGMCSTVDYQVLTLLYQPIIGKSALILYLTLLNLVDRQSMISDEYLHSDLESLLDIETSEIEKERYKLEAIGLLVTFFASDSFTYEIKMPLSARSFVNDGVLGEYLISNITKTRFKKLLKIFKIKQPNKKQKYNISKAFNEIFPKIDKMYKNDYESSLLSGKAQTFRKLNGHDLDWRFINDSVPKDILDINKLTEAIKNKINQLSYVYDLNEIEMKDVMIKSIDSNDNLNIEELARNARNRFDELQAKTVSKKASKKELHKDVEIKSDNLEEYFNNISPKILLEELNDGIVLTSDLKIAERLLDEVGLDTGVINVLLAYIYKQKGNKLPGYAYFQKVALSWKRNKINSVENALNYIKHIDSMKNKKPNYYKQKSKPDVDVEWLDEYLKVEENN
ncbi:MAG: DnaD domain protein [Candidatus Izimaplasma sp.]|nr:DnaD domain protein [Candidatus Izimaplasma bacterium]